jgi:ParB family transcriptional regulator, chromosome partitioning protein
VGKGSAYPSAGLVGTSLEDGSLSSTLGGQLGSWQRPPLTKSVSAGPPLLHEKKSLRLSVVLGGADLNRSAASPTQAGDLLAKTVGMREIPIRDLVDDPMNVRHRNAPIGELEESIAHYGVLEPVIVRPKGQKFAVVIGSRRFTAARAVGLKSLPAIVKELSDEEAFVESAVENIQRETLDPTDELAVVEKAYEIYTNVAGVARLFDRSKKWVEDHLKVHGLVEQIRSSRAQSQGGASKPVEIPRDFTKMANIARAAEAVYEKEPKKREALFEELKDKPREQVDRTVRRLRAVAEEEPEKLARSPVKDVVREVMEPNRLELAFEFSTELSRGILKAARSRGVSEEDIVEIAVEDWLKRNRFI